MANIENVSHSLSIGELVANFLINTGRVLKAIELCKELIVFSKKAKEENCVIPFEDIIHFRLFEAYSLIRDYTNAIKYGRKLLVLYCELGEKVMEGQLTIILASMCKEQCKRGEAKQLYEKAINIMKETGDRKGEANACGQFGAMCLSLGEYVKAKEFLEKALEITKEIGDTDGEAACYGNLGRVLKAVGEYAKAREYLEKAVVIMKETGDREGEAAHYVELGTVFHVLREDAKAQECFDSAFAIRTQIGDRIGAAADYEELGTTFESLSEYSKAKDYIEKSLAINMEIGNREGQARNFGILGTLFRHLGEYTKAQEYHEKALAIRMEVGDREGQAIHFGNLGTLSRHLGEYAKAQEYYEKALAIRLETGARFGEASDYGNLAIVYQCRGEYAKAKEYIEKALEIKKEIGDIEGVAVDYGNLGTVFKSLGEYAKAQEYFEKALAIRIEIGDRNGEASDCGNLGDVFQSLGQYVKAQEYLEKALAICVEIGRREGEATCYGNLGNVFLSLGEYVEAEEYFKKALVIRTEIGDKKGKASDYGNLGTVLASLGEYEKAKEYHEKALAIEMEIGDRRGEATSYGNLGELFRCLGEYTEAQKYLEKAVAIRIEIGDRNGEATDYANLGVLFHSLGEYVKAKKYFEKSLSLCEDIRNGELEFRCFYNLFHTELSQGKDQEAVKYLHQGIRKSEELRAFLEDNDQFKISFSDAHLFSYTNFSDFLCASGKPNDALSVEELRRARALADLMAAQYSLENKQITASPHLWIDRITRKERNCTCLYITYRHQYVFSWILQAGGVINFRKINSNEVFGGAGFVPCLDHFFEEHFRSFGVFPEEDCEDRSLSDFGEEPKSCQEEGVAALRLFEDNEESQASECSLSLCYRMVISPVVSLLKEPEIIVVPDRSLNQVPFAALRDESGNYLSEIFRIRLVPSLSTLKLIQDSPAGYHSKTGALIVGDPSVGQVFYKGRLTSSFGPLPCARKEAEMVGRLLGVQPLLGECATKRAVLERINSVSLIHFAAHGNAERGEIALASTVRFAKEENYLLTMSEISQIQLRAKLVVLSCCHSGRGDIRAEGVVGIARAFLGSGARSVLVALWALRDSAAEQLMNRFYEHLADGETASESLHEAMKWMRGNGFPEVKDWAPFMLIGDNVTFDFGKSKFCVVVIHCIYSLWGCC